MKRFLESITPGVLAVALLLCLVLALGMWHFKAKSLLVATELQQLQASVATQNRTAKAELERLTVERNAAQARLDQQYLQQEKTDAQAVQEIARLTGEHKLRPVRVRIVSQPAASGAGGCRATGEQAASTDPGAADAAEAYGLLSAANSARLTGVIQEIETLNVAYASCRSLLLHP